MEKIYPPVSGLNAEKQAQLLIDEPAGSIDAMCAYEEMLQESLAVVQLHRPEEAHNRFVRHMRQPILAALTTHWYVDLMKNILPELEQDSLEISDAESIQNGSRGVYRGAAARFVGTLTNHFQSSFNDVRQKMENPEDEYHNLWLCHDAGVDLMKSAHLSSSSLSKERLLNLRGLIEDNADVSLDIILQQCRHAMPLNSPPVSSDMSKLTSEIIHNINLPRTLATTNGNLMTKLIHGNPVGLHFEMYEHSSLEDELDFLAECPELFAAGLNMTFRHPSLHQEAWPTAGFCPAPQVLRPRSSADRQVVEDFFHFFENRYGYKINRRHDASSEQAGAFDRVSALMLLATYIAEKTIFPAWPRILCGAERNTFTFLM